VTVILAGSQGVAEGERMFPMQHGEPFIPWAQAEWFYRCYAELFGREQSLERLAQRGGSDRAEVEVCARDVVEDRQRGRYLRNVSDLPAGEAPPWLDPELVQAVEQALGAHA
jgi:hypothetical protein